MKRPERPGTKGEMCILHRTVFSRPTGKEQAFIMVPCRPACPQHRQTPR
jgi:hypothetical protein